MNQQNQIIIDGVVKTVTPEIVAKLFTDFNSEEMAIFFNHIDECCSRWNGREGCWPMQLQYVTEESTLTLAGRAVMQSIGDYSHWGLSCKLNRETQK